MKIKNFEELIAWQKAQDLAVLVYTAFRENKDLGFNGQIFRAVVSISNNIAEGFERSSDADFARFLYISLGSCSEVKSMLYLAARLNYLSNEDKTNLITSTSEVSRIINGLIKSLKK